MTSHGNLGVLHKPYFMVWGNLGKNATLLRCDLTMSHTCFVLQHSTQYCDKSWIHFSWVTLRTSYYLQAVQYLALYIIPFRHVMLNGNATKWDFHCLWPGFSWEIAHMELKEEKLVTRQQKKLWADICLHSIVDAIRRNSGYGIWVWSDHS